MSLLEDRHRRLMTGDSSRGQVRDSVSNAEAGGDVGLTPGAMRAAAAVPLVQDTFNTFEERTERGFTARWELGVRIPSFLYMETNLRRCDASPMGQLWNHKRGRAHPRRTPPVKILPFVRRSQEQPAFVLSSHILLKAPEARRRSSTFRRTIGLSAMYRSRAPVKKAAQRFPTHSLYQGHWHPTLHTFEGQGNYLAPHKVEYEGEFQDGVCHGVGALHYPNAAVVRGVWDHGHLLEPTYFSPDGMEYDPNGPYCKMPDRRYYTEIQRGLRPAGRSQLTNQHPPRPVPPGCYDAGDGIFDPRRNCVYDPETLDVLRVPTVNEMAWIKKNCRKGWDENVGYRPDLFENWEKPPEPAKQKDMEEEEEAKVEEEEEEPKEEEEGEEVQVEEERERAEEEDKLLDVEEVTMHPEMKETYPPVAVQDFTLDAAPPVDILPSLFPETEGEPQTVKEKLMIPVDTKLDPENLRVQQRYLSIADTEKAVAETEGEKEEEEAPAKISPPSTPRLSLDDTGIDYKGPWSHVARRLIPALRQRIDKDRQLAAAKWQEDLMQLLTERASQQGLEMSTSGYLGTSMSLASGEGLPAAPRVIFPPGLEERARQRRAEREERERAEEEKRVEEMLAKEAAHHDSSTVRLSAFGVDDSSTSLDLEQIDISFVDRRKTSVLPASAMSAPKGGRESTMDKLSKKKAIHFQSEVEGD